MREEMRQLGYSKEDEYFHKKDQELLKRIRDAANERKRQMLEQHKGKAYWMKCPKCGSDLTEEVLEQVVRIDICGECVWPVLRPGRTRPAFESTYLSAFHGQGLRVRPDGIDCPVTFNRNGLPSGGVCAPPVATPVFFRTCRPIY